VRVLVASTAGAGHFGPIVPFLQALGRRRDDVLVVGPPSLEAAVASTNHRFRMGAEPPAHEQAAIWERFSSAPREETSGLIDRELFGRLCTAAMLPTMEAACHDWQPDLVVREASEYASAVAAERGGVPHVQVAISLAEIEASVIALVAAVLRPYGAGVVEQLLASPYLTPFPPSLDPSPFSTTWRWRAAPAVRPQPLPDWWGGATGPLVYVTFGSVTGRLPIAVPTYRAALDAVAGLPARVLLTLGRAADVSALGSVPPNVHVEAWVPQGDVFAEAAAVVCHGGSGTTFGTLAAGVPLVIVPLFADQPVNGRLVAAAGAGVLLEPEPEATGAMAGLGPHDARRLRTAIESVLADGSYRRAAEGIADELGALPTVDELLATVAREVAGASRECSEHP